MKARSITTRNVTGGFLGGILGILSFGLIHPAVLPLGCVFGVLVGWWYQEIFQSAVEGWHVGIRKSQKIWTRTVLLLTTPTRKLKGINIDLEPCLKIVHFFTFLVVWIFRRPITFYRWLGKHQMNQVYTIRIVAVAMVLGFTVLWMTNLGLILNQMFKEVEKGSAMEALSIAIIILGFCAFIFPILYPVMRSDNLRDFYSSWSTYSRLGTISFFLKEVATVIVLQLAVITIISGIGVWFIAIGGAFVVMIIAPLSFAIGMVKGIYKVAMKSGHWLCLITTLTVTMLSALQMNNHFTDARILWAVALLTGVASATATEGLRRLIAAFFKRHENFIGYAISPLGQSLLPYGKKFWSLTSRLGDRAIGSLMPVLVQ